MIKVSGKHLSLEEVKNLLKLARNKSEFANLLGYKLTKRGDYSGAVFRLIKSFIKDYNLDTSHFIDVSVKHKRVTKECPQCHKEFVAPETGKESKVTCGSECSMKYFLNKRITKERNEKISKSLIALDRIKNPHKPPKNTERLTQKCNYCHSVFYSVSKSRFCSKFCGGKFLSNSKEIKVIRDKSLRDRVARGDHPGWKVRTSAPSFPEKVIIEIIEELQIPNIVREQRMGRWFMDFADLDRKINLEIDGSQHDLPAQKASDIRKDKYLKERGYAIYRIRWKRLTKEFRAYLKDEVEKIFLK